MLNILKFSCHCYSREGGGAKIVNKRVWDNFRNVKMDRFFELEFSWENCRICLHVLAQSQNSFYCKTQGKIFENLNFCLEWRRKFQYLYLPKDLLSSPSFCWNWISSRVKWNRYLCINLLISLNLISCLWTLILWYQFLNLEVGIMTFEF